MYCPKCGSANTDGSQFCVSCGAALSTGATVSTGGTITMSPPPEQMIVRHYWYAGFWARFVASLIDAVIVAVLIGLASLLLLPFAILIILCGSWLYHAIMESSPAQATLGKQVMGLYVTDAFGEPISFGRATGRHFGKIISGMILMIGYIMAAFTPRKQALHDMMASCLVLKR